MRQRHVKAENIQSNHKRKIESIELRILNQEQDRKLQQQKNETNFITVIKVMVIGFNIR